MIAKHHWILSVSAFVSFSLTVGCDDDSNSLSTNVPNAEGSTDIKPSPTDTTIPNDPSQDDPSHENENLPPNQNIDDITNGPKDAEDPENDTGSIEKEDPENDSGSTEKKDAASSSPSDNDIDTGKDDTDTEKIDTLPQQHVYASGNPMNNLTAYRVARKTNFWGAKEINPKFKQFDVDDADLDILYKVRITQIADPQIHRNVIFMTAGQKMAVGGHPNGLTGQASDWDDDCNDEACTGINLDGRSMAMKLKALDWFPNAWFAVANDNNFDYTSSKNKRHHLVEGFVHWISSQITSDTENVVLAGSSRGGCLVMHIAQALRDNPEYNKIQIYVSSYDGVCIKKDELGVTSTKINNPLSPSGKFFGGWATDIPAQYPNHNNLNIFHIAGGQEVVPAGGVRTFSAYEGTTPPNVGTDIYWGWYRQKWVPWKHVEIGNPYLKPDKEDIEKAVADTIDAQLCWLDKLVHP